MVMAFSGGKLKQEGFFHSVSHPPKKMFFVCLPSSANFELLTHQIPQQSLSEKKVKNVAKITYLPNMSGGVLIVIVSK